MFHKMQQWVNSKAAFSLVEANFVLSSFQRKNNITDVTKQNPCCYTAGSF